MKIGILCGSFDLLHQGHLNLIRRAKRRCDILLVGINSDEYIRQNKGHKPVLPQKTRCNLVKELRDVTAAYIIENGMSFVQTMIRAGIKIDEYYRGDDARGCESQIAENKFLVANNIKPVYFKYTKNISSTKIRTKIQTGV